MIDKIALEEGAPFSEILHYQLSSVGVHVLSGL